MFLVRYFRDSFIFPRILPMRKEPFWKVLIYFIIIVLISLFPYSFSNLKHGGWNLGFVEQNLMQKDNIEIDYPEGITIGPEGVQSDTGKEKSISLKQGSKDYIQYRFYVSGDKDTVKSEIDKAVSDIKSGIGQPQFLFTKVFSEEEVVGGSIYFIDKKGNVNIGDYDGFESKFSFHELNLIEKGSKERMEALKGFSISIEKAFGKQNAFFTIVATSGIQILSYILLILILAGLLQLFKFGYVEFMSYLEGIKVVMLSMTIPSVISFIVGFFTHAFAPLFIQFGVGIILMIVMIKYGKKEFSA